MHSSLDQCAELSWLDSKPRYPVNYKICEISPSFPIGVKGAARPQLDMASMKDEMEDGLPIYFWNGVERRIIGKPISQAITDGISISPGTGAKRYLIHK